MLRKLFVLPAKIWQGRFLSGFSVDGPGVAVQRFSTGETVLYLSLLNVTSASTGHWPFKALEFKFVKGRYVVWHLCVLGLIIGQSMKHDLDEEGNVVGADKRYTYWAFSCINHQNKSFGEVI